MKTHNLGFPRIGAQRELKKVLESYWQGQSSVSDLMNTAQTIRKDNYKHQSILDFVPVGDFSFYDQVLDTSFMLGNIPSRARSKETTALDWYFRVARGRSVNDTACCSIHAGEMTKWFDTNYHYIVPEFSSDTSFELHEERILQQVEEAQKLGVNVKPVIIGPVTYLWLGKEKDTSNKYDLLQKLLPVYYQLLQKLSEKGVEWIQIDEPILITDLNEQIQYLIKQSYQAFSNVDINIVLTSYFGELQDNLELALSLPTAAIHIDAVRGKSEIDSVVSALPKDKILSLGIVDGRNIWKTDLSSTLEIIEPIARDLGDRLWIAPSCSLLHVPVDLSQETEMDQEIASWLAFAVQKIEEIRILAEAVNKGRDSVENALQANAAAIRNRKNSARVHNPNVKLRLKTITDEMGQRNSSYVARAKIQSDILKLPLYPTTTIGSFPQTPEIRSARLKFRHGELSEQEYRECMKAQIKQAVEFQEEFGLDVLAHGEPERNDMVEFFGEQLNGYVFSHFGWVQSYGSRCVKPPIIFGDISRPKAMTVEWSVFAQSLTNKPMKGMLTGPVTMLNWSFVRDDQPRSTTCQQLALSIRDEVLDLERAGIPIIQIDEAALREGLPLRKRQWQDYLDWAVGSFKLAANGVKDSTQIHTHMCYSEFNDIIESIANMDADVITIENSRSDMELLNVFEKFHYPNEIGPGVYDIHSPNVPTVDSIIELMQKAAQYVPEKRLWVNPDCGLKTRGWQETKEALTNMVEAAHKLRA